MTQQTYALPPGSRILVTGANGYIASHVIDLLLKRGYRVRGQVRQSRPWLDKLFQERYGDLFESVVLADLGDRDAVSPLIKDVAGMMLIATDISFAEDHSIIEETVKRTLTWLELAAGNNCIKRVVLTSSAGACTAPVADKPVVFDKDSWNESSLKAVQDNVAELPGLMGGSIYAASKTEGERRAVKWVEENHPPFVFNRVVPYWTLGPRIHPEVGNIFGSMSLTSGLAKGLGDFMQAFPPMWYVSVEDVAQLHVAALLDPELESERIFAMAAPFNWSDVVGIMRKLQPHNSKIPDPPANEGRSLHLFVGVEKAEQILREFCGRPGWTSLEECLAVGLPTYE